MNGDVLGLPAHEIAGAVKAKRVSAREVAAAAIARIEASPKLGAFTDPTFQRALATADAVDRAVQRGQAPPLAGVPYSAKNLFDIAGVTTRAGSRINRDNPPASLDATAIRRADAAGAVLLGAVNMGEYAYDFTGENAHDGASLNPHDLTRMSGGSSGGSGTSVAAGMVAASLGSDTNGSIRVPASFCGLFGLKPTFGRLSRAGMFPFCASIDHVGILARSAKDLALFFDALQGEDPGDPLQVRRDPLATAQEMANGRHPVRIAVADGYFRTQAEPAAFDAVDLVADALGAEQMVTLPDAAVARAAAYVITAAEAGAFHLDRLRRRAVDFDPDVRDRLLAGSMIPAAWVIAAQRFRARFRDAMRAVFQTVDVILAPATPFPALPSGTKTVTLDGKTMPARPNIGIFTQPISFAGLPVVAAPVWLPGARLPIAVQIIAPAWREDLALRVAWQLEREGVASAPVAGAMVPA